MFVRSVFGRGSLHLVRNHRLLHLSSSTFGAAKFAMADTAQSASNTSGVTAASLKDTLTAKLDAQYVEIEDISGMVYCHFYPALSYRRPTTPLEPNFSLMT